MDWVSACSANPAGGVHVFVPEVVGTPDANRTSTLALLGGVIPGVAMLVAALVGECATTGVLVAALLKAAIRTQPSAPDVWVKSHDAGSDAPAIFHHSLTWWVSVPAV